MDDAGFVSGFERVRDLPRDRQRFVKWNGSAGNPIRQSRPLHQFHDESARAARFLDSMDRRDVRMIQRSQQLRFARESGKTVRIRHHRRRQDLERDVTLQSRVMRAIDLAHSPLSNEGIDDVRSDARSSLEHLQPRQYRVGDAARCP
jgi:hypothetical protein